MKVIFTLLTFIIFQAAFSQNIVTSELYGDLEFEELDHGFAKVKNGTTETLSNSPTEVAVG